jgi:membrane protein DedA with SNARE-associated domain
VGLVARKPWAAVLVAVPAMVLGDTIMFFVGRVSGWALLGFLCRVSMNPETCILRSAESFYKRGKATLLIAKFVPGLNTMAPPIPETAVPMIAAAANPSTLRSLFSLKSEPK